MDERRILSTTRQSSAEITRVNFTTVRKGGLDPHEVRLHLESVAREMGHLETRIREMQEQLNEAQRRAANPTFDEATLASALGTQSAAILRAAHEEAGRVTSEAQERSATMFTESQQRAAAHLIEAQERATTLISEAEATATQVEHDARLGAERLIESAKVNGEALVDRAREQGRAIVDQASDARRAVLNDLAVKRKALHLQIEQLRAARDSLGNFIASVRDQVEGILDAVNASDESARQAAIEALRLRPVTPEPSEEELLAGTPLREVPEVVVSAPSTELSPSNEPVATEPKPRKRARPESPVEESLLDDDPSGTDVVNEIFARLRKATLEERGASAPAPKRHATPAKPATPTGELFARRDDALSESLSVLTRRVKRALQDDQNVMLERLRDVKAMITTELEDEHAQRARYADAALDALGDAVAAGAQFAHGEGAGASAGVARAAIDECATDLAVTVVLALRKRILSDGNGDGPERANAAYREWRGARVERLCTDFARRAFHLGVISASNGSNVRFFVAPSDAPCDACALDAASGERPAGQLFPSGSAYPPLHAGCACTVAPV
ncbi:MAG: DivIVA domain-containing protein [Acidobacteriota bacterium]|nr:DivIVA domain-containing protein [Acidobacteriota bacterium]MDE3043277.1 DivIVA domain-containing protein [Acidobacteriota bacterium]MDE3107455.1 DivIVA domain-containing protein [Acidobacteriota bacterium]MDE3222723.1 DivIVA domain-containing protein [Acidobacteriota bacterium]